MCLNAHKSKIGGLVDELVSEFLEKGEIKISGDFTFSKFKISEEDLSSVAGSTIFRNSKEYPSAAYNLLLNKIARDSHRFDFLALITQEESI